jgi:hypothetical protein
MTLMAPSNFNRRRLPLAGNGVGTPRRLLNCIAGDRQMKGALFPDTVARVWGMPLREQPRC